jgi:thiamine-phosphate pyrophosphorylase
VSPAILRIIDANSNRVREALRVLEDFARFHENDAPLSAALKALRHDFQTATAALQGRAIAARDTTGDVGTAITTETEGQRESLAVVVTAAGKRLGEALRTVEEYAKLLPSQHLPTTDDESAASTIRSIAVARSSVATLVEQLRYRWYDLEKSILLRLSPGRERMAAVQLHVLITESLCRRPWLEVAELAIAGGADVLQLREKEIGGGELFRRAKQLVDLCRRRGVICIINDRPDIALLSGAHGVHVGQDDLPLAQVRKLIGIDGIIGVSTRSIDQVQAAAAGGADYVGVGPLFPSTTKPQDVLAGLAYAREAAAVGIPTIGISGITAATAGQARGAGLSAIAVSSAVCSATDPAAAAAAIRVAFGAT